MLRGPILSQGLEQRMFKQLLARVPSRQDYCQTGKGNHLQLGGKTGHSWMWEEESALPAPRCSSGFVGLCGFANEVDQVASGGHSGD